MQEEEVTFQVNTSVENFEPWLQQRLDRDAYSFKGAPSLYPPSRARLIGVNRCDQSPDEVVITVLAEVKELVERPAPAMDWYPGEWITVVRPAITFRMYSLSPHRVQVQAVCHFYSVIRYFRNVLKDVARRKNWPEALATGLGVFLAAAKEKDKRGPTLKTQERAALYKKLKDQHPEWSQAKLAMEANRVAKEDVHSVYTVRNAYRAMGWKWERGDRVY
jgi:hypothetical protein